jgi:hypothetical protein
LLFSALPADRATLDAVNEVPARRFAIRVTLRLPLPQACEHPNFGMLPGELPSCLNQDFFLKGLFIAKPSPELCGGDLLT